MISVQRRPSSTHSSSTSHSMRTDTTWRYSVFGPERLGRGPMLFTGPDGLRDYQATVDQEHRYVGEGTMSPEGTSEVDYLWRAPRCIPFPRPKSQSVGEIGWGIPEYADWNALVKGSPIRGEFRQTAAARHTHRFQNPWYPSPAMEKQQEQPQAQLDPHTALTLQIFPNKSAQFDRYGRRLPPATKIHPGYGGRDSAATDYSNYSHNTSSNPSRASSATYGGERNLYAHYSDSFSRPKSAWPAY